MIGFYRYIESMTSDEYTSLRSVIRTALGPSNPELFNLVTAVAGLLTAVAYADQEIDDAEAAFLKNSLTRIESINAESALAIYEVVEKGAVRISTSFLPRFTRLLVDSAPVATRIEVLSVLVEMAAADGKIELEERNLLRNITNALGLSQAMYNQIQETYRHLLDFGN